MNYTILLQLGVGRSIQMRICKILRNICVNEQENVNVNVRKMSRYYVESRSGNHFK